MANPGFSTRLMQRWKVRVLIAAWVALCPPIAAAAQGTDIGTARNAIGTLLVVRSDGVEQRLSGKGALALYEGDTLQTDASSRALIELRDGVQVGLNRNTSLKLLSRWEKEKGFTRILRMQRGGLWIKAGIGPKQLEVETPVAIAAVREPGEFYVEVLQDGNSILTVAAGVVEFGTAFGTCPIRTDTVSYAVSGKKCTKPEPTSVKPMAGWTAPLTGAPNPLPVFWPPPDASTHQKIPRKLLTLDKPSPTWASVTARMEKALAANGYSDPGYYAVPRGFALISKLERINPDGSPAGPAARWKIQVDPASIVPFNLEAYLRALLGRDAGLFRVIAFLFTPEPIVTKGVEPSMEKEAKLWVGQGGTALPHPLAAQTYGEDMIATALVYEFEIPSHGAPAKLRKPSETNAQQHLRASRILQALGG